MVKQNTKLFLIVGGGGGVSRENEALNDWVMASHIHANPRNELESVIHLSTNSVHKECTSSGKALFLSHVKSLRTKLIEYNLNPFWDG